MCLSLCQHQGPAVEKDASSLDSTNAEMRSTGGEAKPTQRSYSIPPAAKYGQTHNSSTTLFDISFDCQLLVKGVPLTVLGATAITKSQKRASLDLTKQIPCSVLGRTQPTCKRISSFPNSPTPPLKCASDSEKPPPPDAAAGNENFLFACATPILMEPRTWRLSGYRYEYEITN